jgi:hypothetical protein
MADKHRKQQMRDRHKDLVAEKIVPDNAQTQSSAFRLAFDDPEFLCRDDLRPIRLQLEILKPEIILDDEGIKSTIVLFGGARILEPDKRHQARTKALADLSKYYDEARLFAKKLPLPLMVIRMLLSLVAVQVLWRREIVEQTMLVDAQ